MKKGDEDPVLARVGNTSLLRLRGVEKDAPGCEVWAKAEWENPGGSVKTRPALRMLLDGIRSGALTRERTILDASSGNTAVGYALVGERLGYGVELCVPGNAKPERLEAMRRHGATLVLTDPAEGSDGAILECRRRIREHPGRYFYPDQYGNPSNWLAHHDGTGAEILEQTSGRVTHFVAGMGTSGTVMGVGRRLKEHDPRIVVVGVEPAEELHGLEGMKHMASAIVPPIFEPGRLDKRLFLPTMEGWAMRDRLLAEEGLRVGHSSGAAVAATLRVAREAGRGVFVTVLPDGAGPEGPQGREGREGRG
ncbi:MAG: cysteine synthase family protein [Planctomycetales bacterium]|nr:cysteine synthase family protein [Planctomycetales bacterium]